jgi:excisionase family DNA binding protein
MTIRTRRGEELIAADEVCERTGLELTTVYQMARNGEIPGAVWGQTLRFRREEFRKWWESEIQATDEVLRQLEEEGVIMSFVDSNGELIYYPRRLRTLADETRAEEAVTLRERVGKESVSFREVRNV